MNATVEAEMARAEALALVAINAISSDVGAAQVHALVAIAHVLRALVYLEDAR